MRPVILTVALLAASALASPRPYGYDEEPEPVPAVTTKPARPGGKPANPPVSKPAACKAVTITKVKTEKVPGRDRTINKTVYKTSPPKTLIKTVYKTKSVPSKPKTITETTTVTETKTVTDKPTEPSKVVDPPPDTKPASPIGKPAEPTPTPDEDDYGYGYGGGDEEPEEKKPADDKKEDEKKDDDKKDDDKKDDDEKEETPPAGSSKPPPPKEEEKPVMDDDKPAKDEDKPEEPKQDTPAPKADEPKDEPADSPPKGGDKDDKTKCIETHNKYRKDHDAEPLKWNNEMADFAEEHAKKCRFEHSTADWGENIAEGYDDVNTAMKVWYDEVKLYKALRTKDFDLPSAHFTQMVWKATKEFGCYNHKCPKGYYFVCEYNPAGNVKGTKYFAENVSY